MVLLSAGVAGPRPSKASEESVLTSSDSRWVLKLGVSAACALAQAAMISADRSNRLTGGHRLGKGTPDTSTSDAGRLAAGLPRFGQSMPMTLPVPASMRSLTLWPAGFSALAFHIPSS